MPLDWKISHEEHLVTLKTLGALRYHEMESCLAALRTKGSLPYRKLLDVRDGRTAFADHELRSYKESLITHARHDRFGPYAVVVGDDRGIAHAPLVDMLLLLRKRPIRIFAEISEARDWLLAQPAAVAAS